MEKSRMCPNCRAFISASDRVCPYCEAEIGRRTIDRVPAANILGGFVPHAHFLTMVIMLINFGLYAACVIFSMRKGSPDAFMNIDGRTLFDFGAKLTAAIQMGQWWRLITAGFLHGGILHILMNSWVLFDVGAQVEEVYGAARFIVIYFLSTVFGFYLSAWWNPGLSVGASAAIFGLLGAMIALGARHPLGGAIRSLYMRWVIYMLLIGLLPGLHVDMAAHIGGLAAGFAIGWLGGIPKLSTAIAERVWQIAAGVCVVVTALAFLNMYIWFARAGGQ